MSSCYYFQQLFKLSKLPIFRKIGFANPILRKIKALKYMLTFIPIKAK